MNSIKERRISASPIESRQFSVVQRKIAEIRSTAKNSHTATLFENCFRDGIRNVRKIYGTPERPLTYIVTGDINAMWLRDATYQMLPFVHLAKGNPEIQSLVVGTIHQQSEFILRDPYANAHMDSPQRVSPHRRDKTEMRAGIFERKWEPDSLSSTIHLAYSYWKETGDDSFMKDEKWQQATKVIYQTFKDQQRLQGNGNYSFRRPLGNLSPTEKVADKGWGSKTAKIGLVHATHRPSDDASLYSFNIPVNLFVSSSLTHLAEMHENVNNADFSRQCRDLSTTIQNGIDTYGIITHPKYGKIYAYEIDGLGNTLVMDDANIPGFLSLPYLGVTRNEVYENTRRFVLSLDNPYFFKGKMYEGVGSPHTGKNTIWPLSIILRALTTTNENEIQHCLQMIHATQGDRQLLNESVFVDKPQKFTRQQFGMANSLYADLILTLQHKYPQLL